MAEFIKGVYIPSLEASDIYSHMHRGTFIKHEYCGMIPFSLELIKLKKEGFKVKKIESRDKEISNDIINVKFKQNVKSGFELKRILTSKRDENIENEQYIKRIDEFLDYIENDNDRSKWKEVSVNDLRKSLYTEGFKIKHVDKNGEIKETEYVVYKRSSAKSRTGQCLFIKKTLYKKMIKWSRMSLPLKEDMEIDLAGLLAYESLVGSSLEGTITIDPDKILIIDDVESKFSRISNVVRKSEEGFLNSFTEEATVNNSLFDGESLLDAKYFTDGTAMKLLRNHMFKSASFNCNIQKFFKDNCPKDTNYDEWQIEDMYGNELYAKDIDLICTPSSLKSLKFSKVVGTDKDMWNYWKQKVKEDDNLFGVCKHDKQSKLGEDEQGNILQQTSYQMINCLPMSPSDVKELIKTEKHHIERLKNDDHFFINKVHDNSTLLNSNEMLYSLYHQNKKIINTKLYRDFRKEFIKKHVNHSKKGKIKLIGDYCVMLGNPIEFLRHSIGKFDIHNKNELTLKNNEVHTTLFEFNQEYIGFRNPNTSPSNVLLIQNKQINEIEKYFNLTENIVCVNAIDFPIQDILSGCDYDSDTVLLFDDPKMLELGKRCFGNYHVCINAVEGQKKKYKLNKHDMYEIDNQLSTSQRNIGKVVNLGQFCMSVYWDLINKGETGEHIDELLKKVDVMTVLSGIAIDMAKKFYEINIDKEIDVVSKNEELKKRKLKPQFWKYVSQSKTIKNRITEYQCPMDFLISELDNMDYAKQKNNINLEKFIIKKNEKKANRKQYNKVINYIQIMDNSIKSINATSLENDEKVIKIEDSISECVDKIKKLKIKEDTMYVIIKHIFEIDTNFTMRLLNILYETHKEIFLKTFKKGKISEKST